MLSWHTQFFVVSDLASALFNHSQREGVGEGEEEEQEEQNQEQDQEVPPPPLSLSLNLSIVQKSYIQHPVRISLTFHLVSQ